MQYSLRSMSLGEVLDTGWRLYVENFILFISFSLVVGIPSAFLSAWMIESASGEESVLAMVIPLIATLILLLVAAPLASAATTRAIAGRYMNERVSFGSSWTYAFSLLMPLLGAMLLGGILTLGGFILLVIPGIYLMLRFSMVAQVVMVERLGGSAALKRSGALMRGNYGRMILIFLVMWVFQFALGYAIDILQLESLIVYQLLSSTLSAIIGAFVASVITVSYFERRCTHDGFDLERLADSLGRPRQATA